MPSVTLANLTKIFTGATAGVTAGVTAVDSMNLEIPDGALVSFLGPSGCGKTTTLRLVAGLERPSDGEIYIGEQRVSGPGVFIPPERRAVGMVFQSYAIWPHLSVFENVAYPLRVRRHSKKDIGISVARALGIVQLSGLKDRYPAQLSGGQQQRVALARAIVFEPKVLLFDEPLSNLDANLREEMRSQIREVQQRLEITAIYVTHDQRESLAVSDLIAVMQNGRLLQLGAPREIYERPRTRFVAEFVGWGNFLSGRVTDQSNVSSLGTDLRCTVPQLLTPGSAVRISVRPENVIVSSGEDISAGENVMRGKLDTLTYVGQYQDAEIRIGSEIVRARLPPGYELTRGADVGVRLAPEHILIYPEEDAS